MVDIHCHILPLVDDGADSMEDAVEMARMAAESGVRAIIATPHCNLPGDGEKNFISETLLQRFIQLRQAIRAAGIPLDIHPGAEVFCAPDVPDLLAKHSLLTLAGSRYLLVEFFFDESLDYMDDMLQSIAATGRIPVIAHPERYEAVQHLPRIVERWFRNGYIIQLNKGSILGRLGRRAEGTARWILSHGLAHTVASDAHNPDFRTTRMSELAEYLTELCPEDYVQILLSENPRRILENRPVLGPDEI